MTSKGCAVWSVVAITLLFVNASASILFAADRSSLSDIGANGPSGKLSSTRVVASDDPLIAESNYKLWVPADTAVVRSLFVINM